MEGFEILLDFNRLDIIEEYRNYIFFPLIQEHKGKEALKRMINDNAFGSNNIG